MESLQDLVVRRARELGGREGPLSTRDLEAASQRTVSRGVFQKIMAGEYDARIGQRVIDGLAQALQVSVRQVERAAGAPPSFGPFKLTEDAARLTPTQRLAVKHVVEAMLEPGAVAGDVAVAERRLRPVEPAAARAGNNRGRQRTAELDQQAETPHADPGDEPS